MIYQSCSDGIRYASFCHSGTHLLQLIFRSFHRSRNYATTGSRRSTSSISSSISSTGTENAKNRTRNSKSFILISHYLMIIMNALSRLKDGSISMIRVHHDGDNHDHDHDVLTMLQIVLDYGNTNHEFSPIHGDHDIDQDLVLTTTKNALETLQHIAFFAQHDCLNIGNDIIQHNGLLNALIKICTTDDKDDNNIREGGGRYSHGTKKEKKEQQNDSANRKLVSTIVRNIILTCGKEKDVSSIVNDSSLLKALVQIMDEAGGFK